MTDRRPAAETSEQPDATMSVDDVMRLYTPGDEHTWAYEFATLGLHHHSTLTRLTYDIGLHGIREPLLLGNDGRLWDGHHRLLVACATGIQRVPVQHAPDSGGSR